MTDKNVQKKDAGGLVIMKIRIIMEKIQITITNQAKINTKITTMTTTMKQMITTLNMTNINFKGCVNLVKMFR